MYEDGSGTLGDCDPDSDSSGYILLQFAVHSLFGVLA
jgi:hypothetical protein